MDIITTLLLILWTWFLLVLILTSFWIALVIIKHQVFRFPTSCLQLILAFAHPQVQHDFLWNFYNLSLTLRQDMYLLILKLRKARVTYPLLSGFELAHWNWEYIYEVDTLCILYYLLWYLFLMSISNVLPVSVDFYSLCHFWYVTPLSQVRGGLIAH